MTGWQVAFSILAAALTATGIGWAVVSWRKSGADVTAEIGRGEVDRHTGVLRVQFMSGAKKITRLTDPFGLRDKQDHATRKKQRRKSKPDGWDPVPVNAIFVRNRGRTAVTVQRCTYTADLGVTGFGFEPQPEASPWGDHLPARLDPGAEIILIHEQVGMRLLWNVVMKDHGVAQTVYGVVLELGNGKEVFAEPPVVVHVDMTEEELAEVAARGGRVERIDVVDPQRNVVPPRKRFRFFGKDQRLAVVMSDETEGGSGVPDQRP
jgi:hypothetical protein